MIDSNMADMLKNIRITQLDPYRKMIKNVKSGAYIICNNSTNQVESKGVINPNPEYQLQKASEQQQNRRIVDNSFALEMYGLVNLCSGKKSTYDDIQNNMMAAYPSQHRYQMGSEQRNNNNYNYNNKSNAVQMYELVQFVGGGNNINGW